jgi:hypothetical protein
MAQEQMVTQSQYLIAAGVLQQAFFRAIIEYQITASSSPSSPCPSALHAQGQPLAASTV